MAESRIKNSKRNILSGLIKQATTLVLNFAIRTLVIYFLGAEYQGLNGLFTSVLQVLSLADLGFSTAVMFILYKPIAEKNDKAICAIINYLKKVYFIIGVVILLLGICLLPFLPFLISGEIPSDINLYVLFVIYLINAAASYLLFAYKSTLLSAMQKENIVSNVYTITFFAVRVLQIIFLALFRNYYVYIIVLPVGTIINSILVHVASKRIFPQIIPKGEIDSQTKKIFKKQVLPIFIGRVGDIARNSLDNIIISVFFGLTLVAVYDNYYYIYSALYGIMGIIIHGMLASVGNSIASERPEKNYDDLLKINFIFMLITGWCTVCMFCLYQPFMAIWMKGDVNMMLSDADMALFCLYFYCINMTYPRSMYLDGKGLFFESRYWCVLEALANLVLNILLGKWLGITGIIIATVFTIFVFNFIGRTEVLFKHYFVTGKKKFYLQHLLYFAVTVIVAIVSRFICSLIPDFGVLSLPIILVVCCALTGIVYLVVYFRTQNFRSAKELVFRVLHIKRR